MTKGSLLDEICALEETIKRKSLEFLDMLNVELPDDPAVPLLGIYTKEMKTGVQTKLYMKVHNGTVHKYPKDGNIPGVHQLMNG